MTDERLMQSLDAYGHLTWTVGFSDEWTEDPLCECASFKPSPSPAEEDEEDWSHGLLPVCVKCDKREHRGDWLACFDYNVATDDHGVTRVAYHVVVNSDSGGFIDTLERGVVGPDKAPYDLPDYWTSIGIEHGTPWSPEEMKQADHCQTQWSLSLREAITQSRQRYLDSQENGDKTMNDELNILRNLTTDAEPDSKALGDIPLDDEVAILNALPVDEQAPRHAFIDASPVPEDPGAPCPKCERWGPVSTLAKHESIVCSSHGITPLAIKDPRSFCTCGKFLTDIYDVGKGAWVVGCSHCDGI